MAVTKWVNDSVLDAALNYIKSGAARANYMVACSSGGIDTFGEAWKSTSSGGFRLTQAVAMASGDFTISSGDVSGRKLIVASKSSVPIEKSGAYAAVALVHSSGSSGQLVYVTSGSSQNLVLGGNATFPAWDIEFRDPTNP